MGGDRPAMKRTLSFKGGGASIGKVTDMKQYAKMLKQLAEG